MNDTPHPNINFRELLNRRSSSSSSSPQTYLRELLRYGTETLLASTQSEHPSAQAPQLEIFVAPPSDTQPASLRFGENTLGLSIQNLDQLQDTLQQRARQTNLTFSERDRIELLAEAIISCFAVAEHITIHNHDTTAPFRWSLHIDGTSQLETLPPEQNTRGTSILLQCKRGFESYFEASRIGENLAHFGATIPYPVLLHTHGKTLQLNDPPPPWREHFPDDQTQQNSFLRYGKELFGLDFFECIPISSKVGDVEGLAFILPFSPNPTTKRSHRVYLRNILLSENAENLLPDWALFATCVLNTQTLRPTRAHDALYEDHDLLHTKEALGQCLRSYLFDLREQNPQRLQKLLDLHTLSLKKLAAHDDEFFRAFLPHLPFHTNLGEMTFQEIQTHNDPVLYITQLDQFRQVSHVASAQSLCIINGSQTHDTVLLAKLPSLFPRTKVELFDASNLSRYFDELSFDEQDETAHFVQTAQSALKPFDCITEIKKFLPREMPALYSINVDSHMRRTVEQSKALTNHLWSSVLDSLVDSSSPSSRAQLCFNYHNPLIRKLLQLEDQHILSLSVQMLYVQALIRGNHPLSSQEMELLNEGLLDLLECTVDAQSTWDDSPSTGWLD